MDDAIRVLKELTELAHRLKSDSSLSTRLRHRAYQLHGKHYLDPFVRHALAYVLHDADLAHPKLLTSHVASRSQQFQRILRSAHQEAIHTGALRLRGSIVADNSPLVQQMTRGKKAARIDITKPEATLHHKVRAADIVVVGGTRVTPEGVVAPLGTGLALELARNSPTYVALLGLQITRDPKIDKHEELISPEHITGIISELGVFKHQQFLEEARRTYPFTSISWP